MAGTTTDAPTDVEIGRARVARMEAVWAQIAESTKDLTDEEREELAERLADEVKRGIRERIRRGEPA